MMRRLRLCLLTCVVCLAACSAFQRAAPLQSPAPPVVPATPTVQAGQWTAFAIDGLAEVVVPRPVLRWVRTDAVEGSAGCIGFTALALPRGASLRFTSLLPVGKPCLTLPGGQEDKFFKALEQTRAFQFADDDQLVLVGEGSRVLARFTRSL